MNIKNFQYGAIMVKSLLFFSIFLILIIAGCSSGLQTVDISLKCDENSNENNALVLNIYQLKNSDKFLHASFESLSRNPEEILAGDLIPNTKFEKTMIPNESFMIKDLKITNETLYLGVIGNFYSPLKDGWKEIIPVNSDLENLSITIHQNSLSVKKSE
jgi:type VI secretion system VasD/TssJ family lipoprotein